MEKYTSIDKNDSKMISGLRGHILIPVLMILLLVFMISTNWLNWSSRWPEQGTAAAAKTSAVAPSFEKGFYGFFPVRKVSKNNNNIFFIETSCVKNNPKNYTGLHLNGKQACAVYSAAKYNPSRSVVLFHTCEFQNDFYERSSAAVKSLLDLPNFSVVTINIDEVYKHSLLKDLWLSGALTKSVYPIEHHADILRILLVYNFGGTYMDLDVISLKPLDGLGENYIGAQEETQLGSGIFHFKYDGPGHDYLGELLMTISKSYDPNSWAGNGPVLAGTVLKKFCKTTVSDWRIVRRIKSCNITVAPLNAFYPIGYMDWEFFYNESKTKSIIEQIRNTYVLHMWNHMNSSSVVRVGSNQPYAKIAEKHCGPVYWHSKPYL